MRIPSPLPLFAVLLLAVASCIGIVAGAIVGGVIIVLLGARCAYIFCKGFCHGALHEWRKRKTDERNQQG